MANKSNIGNAVGTGQLLEFKIAFPKEEPLTLEEYLRGGSRSVILNAAAFFLGFKSNNSRYNDNAELLSKFFRKENNEFANEVYSKIKALESPEKRVGIIHVHSSLTLFEFFFSKKEEKETQTSAAFEKNLFKAYILLNSEFTKAQEAAILSTKHLDKEFKIPMMMFCSEYPIFDKAHYDLKEIWATQIIKATFLFQFLERHEKMRPLLDAFLTHFNNPTWEDYLKSFLPLTTPGLQNEKEAHTDIIVNPGENFEQSCAFIEKLIVQETEKLDENDFLTLRARPFYKVKDGVYRIIFHLFVAEKIFKGVYFFLRDLNAILPKEKKIPDLKSVFGDEFSEKVLLYKVVENIYSDKAIRHSGKELADMKIEGAPDYYLRKGKNILLFESKDFLIRADKKASFDFNVYHQEFQRVLYYEELPNGKEKHKAIMQLINSVRRVLKKEFPFDIDYSYKDVFIYPILITHDHQYDTPGFNYLLNYWFQDELEGLKEEGLFIHHVKPLVVVNIDALIYNQIGLLEDISLHEMLELYTEHIKKPLPFKMFKETKTFNEQKQDYLNRLAPFSLFLHNYFNKQGINKIPPILETIAPALFKNETIE